MDRSIIVPHNVPKDLDWLDDKGNLVPDIMYDLKRLKQAKESLDQLDKEWRDSLLECMEKYGIKGYDDEDIKVQYKEPSEREKFDKKGFCEDPDRKAEYDKYVSFSPVKSSITVTVK